MAIYSFLEDQNIVVNELKKYLKSLFNKKTLVIYDIRESIQKDVLPMIPHVATYDQRILSIISNCTFICSEPFDKRILLHYQKRGLSQNVDVLTLPHQSEKTLLEQILDDKSILESLKGQFETMVVFFPTNNAKQLSEYLGCSLLNTIDVSMASNNKTELKKYIINNGLPYIDGVITSQREIIQKYYNEESEYFFKLPHGVSGYGFFTNKKNSIDEILSKTKLLDIIIEKAIMIESSPSVQFFIDENNAYIFGITDQILIDGRYYNGNQSPSQVVGTPIGMKMIDQAKNIFPYLLNLGFKGFGGIDFMVTNHGEVYIAEINARFTGATPPTVSSILLHDIPHKNWIFKLEENIDYGVDELLEEHFALRLPICLGGLQKRKQLQNIYFLPEKGSEQKFE